MEEVDPIYSSVVVPKIFRDHRCAHTKFAKGCNQIAKETPKITKEEIDEKLLEIENLLNYGTDDKCEDSLRNELELNKTTKTPNTNLKKSEYRNIYYTSY